MDQEEPGLPGFCPYLMASEHGAKDRVLLEHQLDRSDSYTAWSTLVPSLLLRRRRMNSKSMALLCMVAGIWKCGESCKRACCCFLCCAHTACRIEGCHMLTLSHGRAQPPRTSEHQQSRLAMNLRHARYSAHSVCSYGYSIEMLLYGGMVPCHDGFL